MKREILFKAKAKYDYELEMTDVKVGDWVYGYFVKVGNDCYIDCCPISDNVEIDPNTLCEYIGKTNSKNEKLFEGDYCKNEDYDLIYLIAWNHLLCRFDIRVCANMEQAKSKNSINRVEINKGLGFVDTSSFFPIGNIHDSEEE